MIRNPEEIHREIVPQILSTGETWFPMYGQPSEVNAEVDDVATSELDSEGQPKTVTFPLAVLQKPITIIPQQIGKAGIIEWTAPIFVYFLYDIDEDLYLATRQLSIDKARAAAEEYIGRLMLLDEFIEEVRITGGITDIDNFLDRNTCGVTLQATLVLVNNGTTCYVNQDTNIVSIYDAETQELVTTVPCGQDIYLDFGAGSAIVTNSDNSYIQSGDSPLELPDTTYNIYVNGELDQSFSVPTLKDETINISP